MKTKFLLSSLATILFLSVVCFAQEAGPQPPPPPPSGQGEKPAPPPKPDPKNRGDTGVVDNSQRPPSGEGERPQFGDPQNQQQQKEETKEEKERREAMEKLEAKWKELGLSDEDIAKMKELYKNTPIDVINKSLKDLNNKSFADQLAKNPDGLKDYIRETGWKSSGDAYDKMMFDNAKQGIWNQMKDPKNKSNLEKLNDMQTGISNLSEAQVKEIMNKDPNKGSVENLADYAKEKYPDAVDKDTKSLNTNDFSNVTPVESNETPSPDSSQGTKPGPDGKVKPTPAPDNKEQQKKDQEKKDKEKKEKEKKEQEEKRREDRRKDDPIDGGKDNGGGGGGGNKGNGGGQQGGGQQGGGQKGGGGGMDPSQMMKMMQDQKNADDQKKALEDMKKALEEQKKNTSTSSEDSTKLDELQKKIDELQKKLDEKKTNDTNDGITKLKDGIYILEDNTIIDLDNRRITTTDGQTRTF